MKGLACEGGTDPNPTGEAKGLNEVEADACGDEYMLLLATSANGERVWRGEAKPKPRVEVRDAEGNWRAEGGC